MTSQKEALIRDAISFLKDSFASTHQFLVSSSYPIKGIKKKEATPLQKSSVELPVTPPPTFSKKTLKEAPKIPQKEVVLPPPPSKERNALSIQSHKNTLLRLFPQMIFKETPLCDTLAHAMGEAPFQKALQAPILLLCSKEEPFLQNLQKAICLYFSSCFLFSTSLCKTEKDLEFLIKNMKAKYVIAESKLLETPCFLSELRHLPATSEQFLANSPLITLQPINIYQLDPNQKKVLWHTLCKKLSSLRTSASS
jgi:hypothetical protein